MKAKFDFMEDAYVHLQCDNREAYTSKMKGFGKPLGIVIKKNNNG